MAAAEHMAATGVVGSAMIAAAPADVMPMAGCAMDHGNCVAVLRAAVSLGDASLAVVLVAAALVFAFLRLATLPVSQRGPPVSLVRLCISRT